MAGSWTEGEKARTMRRERMSTGTNMSANGGGGSGGQTNGRSRRAMVNTNMIMVVEKPKYLTIYAFDTPNYNINTDQTQPLQVVVVHIMHASRLNHLP